MASLIIITAAADRHCGSSAEFRGSRRAGSPAAVRRRCGAVDELCTASSHLPNYRVETFAEGQMATLLCATCRRRPRRYHDGAAKGPKPVGRGSCLVVVAIVVQLSFASRPVALPVMARLYRSKARPSEVEQAASMIRLLAACYYGRALHVVADAAYHGEALRELRDGTTITTRLPANAVLYDLAPPRTGKRANPHSKAPASATAPTWTPAPQS